MKSSIGAKILRRNLWIHQIIPATGGKYGSTIGRSGPLVNF